MKPTLALRFLFPIIFILGCTDESTQKTIVKLDSKEVSDLMSVSNQFNALTKQKMMLSLIKTSLKEGVKRETLDNFFSSNFEGANLNLASEILEILCQRVVSIIEIQLQLKAFSQPHQLLPN